MSKHPKTLQRILSGRSDSAIRFDDLVSLLRYLGFIRRVRGDHHLFTRRDVVEILNLQPKGAQAKPYQVKQIRELLVKYRIGVEDHE